MAADMPNDKIDFDARMRDLLGEYGDPQACAAELLCDRHPADAVAFTVVEPELTTTDITYGELREKSRIFAAVLADLGVEQGDAVGVLMGKSEELVVALLGIWRRGAVHVPLFTAFAPPAIALRLTASGAKVVVADEDQKAKLAPGEDMPAGTWTTVVVGATADGERSFQELMASYSPDADGNEACITGGDAPLILMFTSGATGVPKGVTIPVRALASIHSYLEFGLDVRESDVFWNAADPGWAYGLFYAIAGPLAMGRPSILLHAGFSPSLSWQVMDKLAVTNFAGAPTVYRALRNDPTPIPEGVSLRCASSAGEPLTPDVISWAQERLDTTVRDHYGQTEHGMMICNCWADWLREEVRPGSMGRPIPGWSAEVLLDDADEVAPVGTPGRVAIDTTASPMMWFNGYLDAPDKTAERYTADGRWYLTGDAGAKDEEGYFFFSSRDDDVIIMAGYRIGPFEVESVLAMHDAVAECAAVGVPDELRGEVLEAYVVLASGATGSDALTSELQALVKTKFAAHAYPRVVHYVEELPKTPSGKVQRFILRKDRTAQLRQR